MSASNAGSLAILKRRFPGGEVPRANYQEFPAVSLCEKYDDFDGDDYVVPIITENPQGVGTTVQKAQEALAQSTFTRFLLTRTEYFGVARIKGQALKTATKKGGGALVDLWVNEMDGITQTVLKMLEIFFFGTGNAVLGTIASGNSTVTITLTVAEDIANFDLGGRYGGVTDTTLSPTIRSGSAVATGIDRAAGTLTAAAAWNSTITSLANGDSLVRAGTSGTDGSVAGTAQVPMGMRQWLIGGTTPGTIYSLNRNSDPVRLASQTFDMTGLSQELSIIDLESLISFQGKMTKRVLMVNPRDLRQLKKSLSGKVTYPRATINSTVAGISFSVLQFEGDGGTISIVTSPFCPKGNVFMLDMSTIGLYSSGGFPMLLDFDKAEFLRVATDDSYEVRVGGYGAYGCRGPSASARGTNWGN